MNRLRWLPAKDLAIAVEIPRMCLNKSLYGDNPEELLTAPTEFECAVGAQAPIIPLYEQDEVYRKKKRVWLLELNS